MSGQNHERGSSRNGKEILKCLSTSTSARCAFTSTSISIESPIITTGAALYALGKIAAGMALYREAQGDREDPTIENGPEAVELQQDEHFHSGPPRTYTIYVNGEQKSVTAKTVTFEQIVALAFPTPPAGQTSCSRSATKTARQRTRWARWSLAGRSKSRTGWFSMSHPLISRSPDLKKLRDEGYDLEIRSGFLLVKGVPYVNASRQIQRGTLVAKLVLAGDVTTRPDDHVAYLAGEHPCRADGTEIPEIKHASGERTLAEGVVIQHSFSAKPKPSDFYPDYHAKMVTYAAILSGPAQVIDPAAKPQTFPVIQPETDRRETPFNYIDTASSRAEIDIVTAKLKRLNRIAHCGPGRHGLLRAGPSCEDAGMGDPPLRRGHVFTAQRVSLSWRSIGG